ncbi:MAG: ROK family protein [Alistipes sp.]|nr:ROK family protein [Alistipes sp.]
MKKLAIGIDIGGTNTAFGLVDKEGEMYGESIISTKQYPDFDQYIEELYIGIQNLIRQIDFPMELVGIGIGGPNANYYNGTIENAANLIWEGVLPVVEKMKRFFPSIPVIITNDANAAAIGEMVYGGAKGMKDFIVVTLGTGLGSGFVANGKLIYGHDSFAGELGHVIVNRTGRVCGCGRKGCLETYVSATGIKRTVFKLLADHLEDSEFRYITYNDLTAEMITKAALNGDPLAIEAYEYTGMLLGQALADAVTITSPEAIFLFGGLAKAGKYLIEPTRKYMEMHMLSNYRNKVKLLPSGLHGKNAAILGASALAWDCVEA